MIPPIIIIIIIIIFYFILPSVGMIPREYRSLKLRIIFKAGMIISPCS